MENGRTFFILKNPTKYREPALLSALGLMGLQERFKLSECMFKWTEMKTDIKRSNIRLKYQDWRLNSRDSQTTNSIDV